MGMITKTIWYQVSKALKTNKHLESVFIELTQQFHFMNLFQVNDYICAHGYVAQVHCSDNKKEKMEKISI